MQSVLVAMMVSATMAVLALGHLHPALDLDPLSHTGVVVFLPPYMEVEFGQTMSRILSSIPNKNLIFLVCFLCRSSSASVT